MDFESIGATRVLVPTGALGTGVHSGHVARGLALGADVIACDAGSTDSGPAYLSTGSSKYSRDAVKADLRVLVAAQSGSGVPLLIGSCGTSGCDAAVDWTRDIVVELALELGVAPRIATLYSEQAPVEMARRAAAGRVRPLAPMTDDGTGRFADCAHVVALMGPEPYIAALRDGADIVLGGRTTDTAVLAALPLMRGHDPAACWHAGKIGECGGLCAVDPRDGGVLLTIAGATFTVEPLSANNRCTPHTVSAHMLYENSDPFRLIEPGGTLDVSNAAYSARDDRSVMVAGATFEPQPYTMKLEGAGSQSFQTIMFVGIRDPKVLSNVDPFLARMHATLAARVDEAIGPDAGRYDISLRPYGWSAVIGAPAPGTAAPAEIGLMFVATAETQDMASRIAKTCNPWFFHLPVADGVELPSYAFPFSPAEIDRGPTHAFLLNHVVEVDDPLELVRVEYRDTEVRLDATA